MSEVHVVPPGGGEVIGDSPERRVELLCDHPAVHVTVSRYAAGRAGADLHIHRHPSDLFYVLEGELTLRLTSGDIAATAGTLVCVPPLVVHGFKNASEREMRYLNLHAPGTGFADYMRGLRDGERVVYDQEDPPADTAEIRPPDDVKMSHLPLTIDAVTVTESRGGGTSQRLEAYYVLAGELSVNDLTAPAGSWVQVPAGVPHTVAGDAKAVRISAG
jgi:quercetin dioxygenase-like cupin family protein